MSWPFGFYMPYQPITDVPNIETSAVDAQDLDPMMSSVIEATRFALRQRNNFKKRVAGESELIYILRSQLLLFSTTHKSLRIILASAYNNHDYSLVPDATSLVREQIEKIYIVALFLDNPRNWIMRYSRTGWRSDYDRYLLELEEFGEIERQEEFLTKHYPEYLEKIRRPQVGKKLETVVSNFAKGALKYRWEHPGDEKPSWFVKSQRGKKKKIKTLREYVRGYFEFPTPGRAAAEIGDQELRKFLYRWHKEYSSICEYSHVAFGKLTIPVMSDEYKDWIHGNKTEKNGKRLAERTVYLSMISAATSCALIVKSLKNTYGARAELKNFWKVLYETSLPGKVFWEMYIKTIL